VLSLIARVHLVRDLEAGERVSYGRTTPLPKHSRVAVVPLGYADGVTRRLGSEGGEVLIVGKRRRICGTVTMDQLIVDCGDDDIRVGERVVLIGRQGDEEITADEWASRLGTIPYEVLCGIGPRVPRVAGRWIAAAEDDGAVVARS
jgi:alanine racemase